MKLVDLIRHLGNTVVSFSVKEVNILFTLIAPPKDHRPYRDIAK